MLDHLVSGLMDRLPPKVQWGCWFSFSAVIVLGLIWMGVDWLIRR